MPFAYERLPNFKQLSLNSSNIIIFQTIYPLEQKLDWRQQADRLHRKAEIIPLRCQRKSSIEQPSSISSNIIFQTMSSLAETWWEMPGKINSEWLEQFFSDIKERACTSYSSLNSSNNIFYGYIFLTVQSVVWDCGNSWSYPLVICLGSLGQWKDGLCNASVARLLAS